MRTSKTQTALNVTVRPLKHDGRAYRSWATRLVRRVGALIVLEGFFAEEVRHTILGTIEAGTLSREFYWTDRWYSVFRFSEPAGVRLRCFYCNVNTPPRLEAGVLSFVDLDVDVLVRPDFSFQVLDLEEFETHAEMYDYPPLFRRRVQEAIEELVTLIGGRRFPFSFNH